MGWFAGCCGGKDGKADPNLREQIIYAAKATGRILEDGFRIVPGKVMLERRKICDACEHQGKYKCKVCGCLLILKRPLATESCPDGRWS